MADVRTLKLNLLADVSDFNKKFDRADDSTKKLERKIKTNSGKMAKSFALVSAAIGIMVGKLAIDAVKAAADDEVSQEKLRINLANTAKIYDTTVIESIETFIEKMQFATGFSDVDLRDALGRLNVSTKDVSDSQDILNVAMDTARGTGKPLGTIVEVLAKAYDGNYTPLKKMGIKLDENTISTKNFQGVTETLTDLFGGQAATYADTYQGKLDIVNERFSELKESAGAKLLDPLKKLLEVVDDVAQGFSGDKKDSGLSGKVGMLQRELGAEDSGGYNLGESLKELADAFGKLFDAVNNDKDSDGTLNALATALTNVANGINAVADAYRKAKGLGGSILDFISIDPGEGPKFADSSLGKAIGFTSRAAGGSVMGNQPVRVGEFGPEMFYPGGKSGSIRPDNGSGVTIIMNGVIDGESARRSIERLLQDSSRRTGAINLVGATL
jgi:hypothetical protein